MGKIYQIIGPVVDVRFEGVLPPVYGKLKIKETDTVLEVLAHVKKGVARCISMSATEGLSRGMEVLNCGTQIDVPVGEAVLGNRSTARAKSVRKRVGTFTASRPLFTIRIPRRKCLKRGSK